MKTTLKLRNIGQIKEADIRFGDLTVFVGPQATGKSIALQWLKLVCDVGQVQSQLKTHGIVWEKELAKFLDVYFGEGMRAIWRESQSEVSWNDSDWPVADKIRKMGKSKAETVFLIPAQRVLTLREGWPRPFSDYSPGDPFSVRWFSESLRLLMERELGSDAGVFPKKNRLKIEYRQMLKEAIFGGFELTVDRSRSQKRLVLGQGKGTDQLPYMVWSAGQREFVPLLLGLYWLLPPSKVSRRDDVEWVIIEEPEMGMHPRAVTTILMLTLELIHRGYRVCISTHSPQILELVWVIRTLQDSSADSDHLLELFKVRRSQQLARVAEHMFEKEFKVYFFGEDSKVVRDISDLDSWSTDESVAQWGGLVDFSGRASEIVATAVSAQS